MSIFPSDVTVVKQARVEAPQSPEPKLNIIAGFGYDLNGKIPYGLQDNPNCQKAISRSLSEEIHRLSESMPRYSQPETFPRSFEIEPIRSVVMKDLALLGNTYHNQEHTEQVIQCFRLLSSFSTLLEQGEESLPASTALALKLERIHLGETIALLHDNEHAGIRYKQRDPLAVIGGIRGKMSNEEWASWTSDGLISNLYSPRQRLIIQAGILATSFAQSEKALADFSDKDKLKRPYAPTTKLEHLICFADIGSFLFGSEKHLDNSLKFLSEVGQRPESFEKWKAAEKEFLKFIQYRFNELVKAGVFTKAGEIEIGKRVATFEVEYNALISDHKTRQRYYSTIAKMHESVA